MGKDHKKSRREEKDHGSKERERSKTTDTTREREKDRRVSSRDAREDTDEYNNRHKEKEKVKMKEKDYDHERNRDKEREREKESKDRVKEKELKDRVKDKDRERQRETEKEHHDRGRERKEKERDRDREKERDREKHKDREREKDKDRDREKLEREKTQGKDRDRERKVDGDSKERHKDRVSDKYHDEGHNPKESKAIQQDGRDTNAADYKQKNELTSDEQQQSSSELERRILQMKEERLKKGSEGVPEILAWVSKSRKLEEKMNAEKEKALHLSRVFEEQDNIVLEEDEDKESAQHTMKDLAGVKVLHGLDKVIEGGAVVLTLKDQSILADGDINDEVDMLENVEIGEQKQRNDAYKAAKKKTGIYDDKFNDEPGAQKKILPQYDDPVDDEVVTLDESGRFTGKAEKKLEELRKKILGVSTTSGFEDLNSSGKVSSDYYTQEEMLQFKKPKKKKALRKKEKLDLDALEAEAISAGLGAGDLGSRKDGKRQIAKEEQERSEAQSRNNAYQTAFAKAEEASKALRQNISSVKVEEEETPVFGDEDEDLYKSLEKARKLALKKQEEKPSGLQAVASLALASRNQAAETQNVTSGEPQENRIVFTEMDEFVAGLQLDGEAHKTEAEDMYMDEDEVVKSSDHERKDEKKDESGGWTEVDETSKVEHPANEEREEIVLDDTIHEAAVGKGLSGALKLLKERGTLKETIEWGGRNMDKKKSKLVGIYENDGTKEIHIERRDEFGRIMTPKEAFRMISHKFHGKEPGKMKKEKRMKQFQDDLKMKQMKNSDTPSQSMERMREAQARLQTPYLVLSGHVKPGQNSDPKSGFATVEDLPGGLTPMLGDRKVEHFLGIKRKADEPGSMGPPKKPKN